MTLSSTSPRTYRIYALVDPRSGEARYVGQTADTLWPRLRSHLRQRKLRTNQWLAELTSLELEPQIALLGEFAGLCRTAYEGETHWIRRLTKRGRPWPRKLPLGELRRQ